MKRGHESAAAPRASSNHHSGGRAAAHWLATGTGFLVAAVVGMGMGVPTAGASKGPSPDQEKAATGNHSHAACARPSKGTASCYVHVIDHGAANPTPLTFTSPYGVSPATLKGAYGFPTALTAGSGTTIAIVDAYNSPTAQSDLDAFDSAFGLPCSGCLTKVDQNGGTNYPAANASWGLEISLDVQWVHAIAPGAHILLVETNTNNWSDLMAGVDYAKAQASYVSASWGGPEWSGETAYDSHFTGSGVSFFTSAGDNGLPANYPSSSPNVVSVGGTRLNGLGTSTVTETAWSGGGGGCSAYEPATASQRVFAQYGQVGCSGRATPDVSLDADPASGVSVYDSNSGTPGWLQVGGTSASSPMWTARSAVAGGVMDSARLYGPTPPPFRDITSGNNGAPALVGYDLATGRGSWYDGVVAPPPPTGTGISNGGFETGDLTGWTPTGAIDAVTTVAAHSGTYAAQLGTTPAFSNGDSTIAQRFTVPSNGSAVGFWYKETCPDTVTYDWATATLTDNTAGGTATVLPPTCTTNPWTQVTGAVTGGHDYTLALTNHDDGRSGDATATLFDDVTITTSGTATNDFTISNSPGSMSLAPNTSGTSMASTTVASGSAATVNLTASVSPAGPSVSLSPTSVMAGGSSTTAVSAGSAAPGSYMLTVTGTEGSMTHSSTVIVTVTAPPATDDFSISAPGSLSLVANTSGTWPVTTAVTAGSAATVNLTASVSPAGPTVSLSPTSVLAGGSSTATMNTGSALPGVYLVTVTGTEGSMTHSTTASVTISLAPLLPGAPSLTAQTSSVKGVNLTWAAPSGGATSYTVYRSRSSGNESSYATVNCSASTCSFTDSSTHRNWTYYYRVSATNVVGTGPLSNEVSAQAG